MITLGDIASQIDQALFGGYDSVLWPRENAEGKTVKVPVLIIPRGRRRQLTVGKFTFVTQDPHEPGVLGHLALENVKIVWIEVEGKARGDGYVNAQYVQSVANHCLGMVSARV